MSVAEIPHLKVLVVEDEDLLRHAITDKSQLLGWTMIEAENGEIGLQTALKEHPDVIILDVLMPKMDGMTMLSHLRQDEWGHDVPVYLLTNMPPMELMNQNLANLGPAGFFLKSDTKLTDFLKDIDKKHSIK